jgi:hypothetical protein
MKKLFVLFVMSLFVVSASFAQINKNWDGTKPEVYKGSKNFVFTYSPFVSNNFGGNPSGMHSNYSDTINSTVSQMYGLGFQYFVTNEIGLVAGISFGSSSWEPKWAGSTGKTSTTMFGLSVDGNYHFKALYGVSPYLGLNVNFGSMNSTTDWTAGTASGQEKSSGSSVGFGANFGFDWYFAPGISLGGKYTLGMQMNGAPEVTSTNGGTSLTRTGPKTSSFGTGVTSIMLNVHF